MAVKGMMFPAHLGATSRHRGVTWSKEKGANADKETSAKFQSCYE